MPHPPQDGRFRASQRVLDYIAELDQKGVNAKQIQADVAEAYRSEPTSMRSVSRILQQQRAARARGEREAAVWSPREPADGVDVAVAIAALASLINSSEGRRQRLTIGEAKRITFVRRAAPDIPIELAFRVAQMYARTTPETVLDAYLAFAPWRGMRERRAYLHAIDEGWLPRWSPDTLAQLLNVRADELRPGTPAPEPASEPEAARLSWPQLETMADVEREALEAAAIASSMLEDEARRGAITSPARHTKRKRGPKA